MNEALPERLVVELHGRRVGWIERRGEGSRFVVDEAYAAMPAGRRPVLAQQLEEDPGRRWASRQGVPSWFEHALPEDGGVLRRLISRSVGVHATRSYHLLALTGRDLPGAVVIRDVEDGDEAQGAEPPLVALDREGVPEVERGGSEVPLRFSLAGVQAKFSARREGNSLVVAASGDGGDWIVKFADQRYRGVPENEHVVMRWAAESGIDVPEVAMFDVSVVEGVPAAFALGEPVFGVRRFDRVAGARVHQEDFAQVFGLGLGLAKYEDLNSDSILQVIATLAPDDIDEAIRRLVFIVLSGNGDAHAKNWSLRYPDKVTPRLSPAYDLLCTVPFTHDQDLALRLGKMRRFDEVRLSTFETLGRRAGLDADRVASVAETVVRDVKSAWRDGAARGAAPAPLRELLDARLRALPLAKAS